MSVPPSDRFDRSDLALLAGALAAGALFFASLPALWPLARVDLVAGRGELETAARRALGEAGLGVEGYEAASRLTVDAAALDYLERSFGRERTQDLIAAGAPVYLYEVHFKERGEPDRLWAEIHPEAGPVGWGRTLQEDAPGAGASTEEARALGRAALGTLSPLPAEGGEAGREEGLAPVEPVEGPWRERGVVEQERPARVDHVFTYERTLVAEPELRERVTVTVAGGRVSAVDRTLVVPSPAARTARARRAPVAALQAIGFLALGGALVGAFAVFLLRLRDGTARLGPPARWAALAATCFVATEALRGASLLLAWDPLWPRWISTLQVLGRSLAAGGAIALLLLVLASAGDALDREVSGGRRGASLWLAVRGRLGHPAVGLASVRGFLVGLLCGGAMAAILHLVDLAVGAQVPIQPRGFFFYALNSDLPALSTLLYFLMVAVGEELGYRFFGASWLLDLIGGRGGRRRLAAWAAVVVPALVYGTTHTGLTFLPPEEPFWGRALVFTTVGCVWGWAFLRFDALTVVLSHWSADLFIFNWPRLASGEPALVATAFATLLVPLLPAAVWLLRAPPGRSDGPGRR